MSIFEVTDYRKFLKYMIEQMPKRGYGISARWAGALGVHPTLISQILAGSKELTAEQALLTAKFFAMNELEGAYLLALVEFTRAWNAELREVKRAALESLRSRATQLSNRIEKKAELTPEQMATFYSSWIYAAIRQAVALPHVHTPHEIAQHLSLPLATVQRALEFLFAAGLVTKTGAKLGVGPQSTHLGTSSPWLRTHHSNWRQRALQEMQAERSENMFYSSPMALSKSDFKKIREILIQSINRVNDVVDPSPSEALYCLNIDWFALVPEN